MISLIAHRYAKALLKLREERVDTEGLIQDLRSFQLLLGENADLSCILTSPIYTLRQKLGLLGDVVKQTSISREAAVFLRLLVEKNRLHFLKDILDVYQQMIEIKEGKLRVEIFTAKPLGKDIASEVVCAIEKNTGKKVISSFNLKPELIGGLMVKIGSKVYDGTVKGYIERMRQQLSG